MEIFKFILTGLLICHFLTAVVHIVAKNEGYEQVEQVTRRYIDPYFIQEWEMFAPPPQSNTKMFYRYLVDHGDGLQDTTDYLEVLEPLHEKQRNEIYSLARLSYYLFNSSQNLLDQCYNITSNIPEDIDPCNKDLVKEYFNERIQKAFSFRSIAKHAELVFQTNHQHHANDKLYFSFHLLEEVIVPYGQDEIEGEELIAYNSGFYPLKI